ncbi:MAG TPA: ergothioneine biosynthesis protein EgtB [Thermoplasmataceae archaeon]|nr:ergothioneine biosynthesis protein EgtB [Thermoplasmatales archaeon AK]HLH85748.1 ergothioneine biosynthesis protein EgtB [Thermoplasmataceae archaeon]
MVDSQKMGNEEVSDLIALFLDTRKKTLELCRPLKRDDYMVQATPDTSPPKWHLGHTTWFFETFILEPFAKGYQRYDSNFAYLFNSYYETVGRFLPKPMRSTISRPSLENVLEYRESVNSSVIELLESINGKILDEVKSRAMLGINHEQQHQELLLMDVKMNYSVSPYNPAYTSGPHSSLKEAVELEWIKFDESVERIGYGDSGFCFDNEMPQHSEIVPAFRIANRAVTNGEYIDFILDGGYERPELWLSDGWSERIRNRWEAPLYWEREGEYFYYFTLSGRREVNPGEPVVHVSYYEADAYARWARCRLPTEAQWEHAMKNSKLEHQGNFLESNEFHPYVQDGSKSAISGPGGVWEWTSSSYSPYPGYRPLSGSLGEYNGKFMANQVVLRGSSCVTPEGHSRSTYRNFYHYNDRWQFSGIRLIRD